MTPGLGEPHLEQTHAEAEAIGQEDDHDSVGNIVEEDDDEGGVQVEKGVNEAVEDEEIVTKQVAKRGDVVEHLVEERLDRVDMEEEAEEGDIETVDEEAEADQGPTSEEDNMEVGQDEDVNEGDYEEEDDNEDDFVENEEEVETRDASQAQRTVDISQAELEMPPPGEHRFYETLTMMTMMVLMKLLVTLVIKVVGIMIPDEDAIAQVPTRLKCQKSHETRQFGALPWHG